VVAGLYFFISVTKLFGQIGITFQVYGRLFVLQIREGKHFSAYFKNQDRLIEWEGLRHRLFGKAIFAKLFQIHLPGVFSIF
jgi:hypothetical protein